MGVFQAVIMTLRWPGIEGMQSRRPTELDNSPPEPVETETMKPSITGNDPLGALEEEPSSSSTEEEHQHQQTTGWDQMKMVFYNGLESTNDTMAPASAKKRLSTLPKIVEDIEMDVDDLEHSAENQRLKVCLSRDLQLTLLSELNIIEEVQEWVSDNVKQKIRRQVSMPVVSRRSKVSSGSRNSNSGLNEQFEVGSQSPEDDSFPPPPSLASFQTV